MSVNRTKRKVMDRDILGKLLCYLKELPDDCSGFLAMLLMTGSRRGEALAVRWEAIGWNDGTLHLQRVIRFRNDASEVSTKMKTASANRTVALWSELIPYLGMPQKSGFIISGGGEPIKERQYKKLWKRVLHELKKLGFTVHFTAH